MPAEVLNRLGTVFDLEIVAAKGVVRVLCSGVRQAEIKRAGSGWYVTSGTYRQSNTTKGARATAIGQVVIYAPDACHPS